jgi:predicted PurR-regulated permease PerM
VSSPIATPTPPRPPSALSKREVARLAAVATAAASGVLVVLIALWVAREIVMVTFLGVLFGLAAAGAVDRLQRWGLRRGIGAAIVVGGAVGLIVLFGVWTAPTLRKQSRELQARVPIALDRVDSWLASHQTGPIGFLIGDSSPQAQGETPAAPVESTRAAGGAPGATPADSEANVGSAIRQRLLRHLELGQGRSPLRVVTTTGRIVAGLLLVIFIALYLAADPGLYSRGVLKLVPQRGRPRATAVMSAVTIALRRWLVAQLLTMVVLGAATTALLLALHVRAALALGVLTALTKFIPTIGAVISGVPAVAMALLESPHTAIVVAIAFVVLQFLENHLLVPLLMQRVDLPPALTLLAQAVMTVIFGPLGLLVAVPALAALLVVVRMVWVQGIVGPSPRDGATEAPPAVT